MNVLDLFKIEDYLECNDIERLHVDYKESVSLADAVSPADFAIWDTYLLRGKNILVFPSDAKEANNVFRFVTEELDSVKWTEECIMYLGTDKKFRVVISVNDNDL